jgi:hypothetical protein
MSDLYRTPVIPFAEFVAAEVASKLPSGSSPWWIARLLDQMEARRDRLTRLRAYYRGTQDTWPLHSAAAREAFGRTFSGMKSNLAERIVEEASQRLKVESFRIPVTSAADKDAASVTGDTEAWRIWQANNMDARSAIAHSEAIAMGECPVIVDRNPDDPATPRITVEDPMQVIVERDPANPRRRLAALKRWTEPDLSQVLILYLPDRVEWWRGRKGAVAGYKGVSDEAFELKGVHWRIDPERSGAPPVPDTVPVVLLVNKARIDGTGQGEHESVIPLLDALNKTILDLLTTSEFAAFPLRYAIGVSLDTEPDQPEDPDNAETDSIGRPVTSTAPIISAINRWLKLEDPDAKVGQLESAALEPYTKAIDTFVEQIGTVSGTPYHLLLNGSRSVPMTGEARKTAEKPLEYKVDRKEVDFGESWEEAMRLAFLTAGDTERASTRSEVRWRPHGAANETQHTDALVKLADLGVDFVTLLEMVPFSPEQIARILARKAAAPRSEADAPNTGPLPLTVHAPDA